MFWSIQTGMLMIDADTVADDAALQDWLSHCFAFVRTLPPK